jgi:hypothetical protein
MTSKNPKIDKIIKQIKNVEWDYKKLDLLPVMNKFVIDKFFVTPQMLMPD